MTLSETVQAFGVVGFKKALIAELKSLAETHQDFRYVTLAQISMCKGSSPKCSYASGPQIMSDVTSFVTAVYSPFEDNTEDQNKGCLFGRALAAMGVDLAESSENIGSLLKAARVDALFSNYCWDIQSEQDSGAKWGELNFCQLEAL